MPCRRTTGLPQLAAANTPVDPAGQCLVQNSVGHPVVAANFGWLFNAFQLQQPGILPCLPGSQRGQGIVVEGVMPGAGNALSSTHFRFSQQNSREVFIRNHLNIALNQ